MSSILDALERAEKERNQLDKKSLVDRGEARPGLFQRRGLWVFAGLLLLINLLIWFWVVMGPGSVSEQSADNIAQTKQQREPLATADAVVSMLEQSQAGKERKSDPPLLVEARVAKKVVAGKPSEPASTSPTPARPTKPVPARVITQPPAKVEPAVTTVESAPETTAQADVTREVEPTKYEDANKLAKASVSQAVPVQKLETMQQDETEQIPLLWELPANVQEKLSDLKINILVYDDDAARRFVIINMHKYREGDSLVPSGMKLQRITRKGVIIDYGDGLVRL